MTFDLCKGHTNVLTKNYQFTGHSNISIIIDLNLLHFEHFCLLAFGLYKGHIHFLTKIHQITGQRNVPTSLDQNLVYILAISSALYYPCSLCNYYCIL